MRDGGASFSTWERTKDLLYEQSVREELHDGPGQGGADAAGSCMVSFRAALFTTGLTLAFLLAVTITT